MSPERRELMARRRRARVVAFEALFEHDVAGHSPEQAVRRRLEGVAALPPGESDEEESVAPVPVDSEYALRLVRGVEAHLPAIDAVLAEAASAWPLEQMAKVDKAILRLAIYEILFDNGVPIRAAINEAVELAKLYGGDSSPRFVNGVLGTVAAQAGRTK
ncbi:MAG: N utilization substance protein B [Dehalococcoidia bacterium]|nr:MAG: N utilization substance protein B [Dehalococcoidia bacterium]